MCPLGINSITLLLGTLRTLTPALTRILPGWPVWLTWSRVVRSYETTLQKYKAPLIEFLSEESPWQWPSYFRKFPAWVPVPNGASTTTISSIALDSDSVKETSTGNAKVFIMYTFRKCSSFKILYFWIGKRIFELKMGNGRFQRSRYHKKKICFDHLTFTNEAQYSELFVQNSHPVSGWNSLFGFSPIG